MSTIDYNELIKEYNILLSKIEIADIKRLELGFINDDCDIQLLSIVIHCIENINIFNDDELYNINYFIKHFKDKYG